MIQKPSKLNHTDIQHITELVNSVYTLTEGDIFQPGYIRIQAAEIEKYIQQKRLLLAEEKQEIVGVVKVGIKSQGLATFGLLSVQKSHWGKGTGKALVLACEDWARQQKSTHIEIEILRSHHIPMPHKDRLYAWYERMAYQFQGEKPVEDMYPDVIPQMIYPGVIQVFLKTLR